MSGSWPPPDQRRSPPSGPYRPQEPPRRDYGEDYRDPGYGAWGPPSGGRGQSGGQWGPPPGGGWGQQPSDPWSPPQGPGGPYGAPPAQPYPPQAPPYPPQYAPYPPQQAPSYAERYGYGYGDPHGPRGGYEPEEPRRSRAGAAALGIMLVVLVLLAAGGTYVLTHSHRPQTSATAQPTVTPAATAVPMRTVTDDTAKIKFSIPQAWVSHGSASVSPGFESGTPDGAIGIVVGALALPPNTTFDMAAGAKGALNGSANFAPVNYERGPETVTLAGESWSHVIGTFTRDNVNWREEAYVTLHASKIYVLAVLAPATAFDAAHASYFQPIEQSFAFLP